MAKNKKKKIEDDLNIEDGVVKSDNSDLRELIEKNLKWSQIIHKQNKNILKKLTMIVVGNYIRLLLFIVPLILALVYLPPFLRDFWSQYGNLLNTVTGSGLVGSTGVDINNLFSNLSAEDVENLNKMIGP